MCSRAIVGLQPLLTSARAWLRGVEVMGAAHPLEENPQSRAPSAVPATIQAPGPPGQGACAVPPGARSSRTGERGFVFEEKNKVFHILRKRKGRLHFLCAVAESYLQRWLLL